MPSSTYASKRVSPEPDGYGRYTFSVTAFGHTQKYVNNDSGQGVLKAKRVVAW